MKFLDGHRPPMVLNATKREKIAKAPSKIAVVHRVYDRIENLRIGNVTK